MLSWSIARFFLYDPAREAALADLSNTDNPDTLSGIIRTITFRNEENGYTVAKLELEGSKRVVAVRGVTASLSAGETVLLRGNWVDDRKYGRQFTFEFCEPSQPATLEGIRRFLASAQIKGIGPVLSERIIDTFGEKTIEVLDRHPERLKKVKGLSPKLVGAVTEGWERHRHIRDIMIFLQSYDISPAYAAKIYDRYKNETITAVRANPYRLIADIRGIGFIKADQVAGNMGIARDAPERIRAGITFCLDAAADDGHVFLPEQAMVERAAQMLELDAGQVMTVLEKMKERGEVTKRDDRIYRPALYEAEQAIARSLRTIVQTVPAREVPDPAVSNGLLKEIESARGIEFAPRQREAIIIAASASGMVITGGPGTGKTTTVLGIIDLLDRERRSVVLCAPTGRAAKRLSEATGREAMTIHRLLEFDPFRGRFKRYSGNPLAADAVIMDEASMADTFLMRDFLDAVTPQTTLVIVGDVDQLPSIGPGNVLRDIIASGVVPTIRLSEIFRQAAASRIVESAHMINRGKLPSANNQKTGNFFFMRMSDPCRIAETIVDLVTRRLPERYGFNPSSDIQVLSPMHRGETGVANLNRLLQERLNPFDPLAPEIRRGDLKYRVGDKVMQVRNNYDRMVFNGDIGRVTAIDPKSATLRVRFEQETTYGVSELDEIVPAFAISVHKSQCSEFSCVVMPLTTQHYIMLKRNLLYTGITRARKLVVLIGDYKALAIAVANDQAGERYTSLAERLKEHLRSEREYR